jgi:hypothetical protein
MIGSSSANLLRWELAARNREYASRLRLPHVVSAQAGSAVVYAPSEDGQAHGNFERASYAAILKNAQWRKRLAKAHSGKKKLAQLERETVRPWCELDSCASSDALLMNIFCFPGVLQRREVISLLGLTLDPSLSDTVADFGLKARVPRANGSGDATEIDMRVGDLLVEAKLTEADFQRRDISAVERYRDFDAVFDPDALPRSKIRRKPVHDHDCGEMLVEVSGNRYESYQMIRNVLAAYALGCRLCVLIHESRVDLRERYHAILRAVRDFEIRTRCTILTWQELSAALPQPLRMFVSEKYGISPALHGG